MSSNKLLLKKSGSTRDMSSTNLLKRAGSTRDMTSTSILKKSGSTKDMNGARSRSAGHKSKGRVGNRVFNDLLKLKPLASVVEFDEQVDLLLQGIGAQPTLSKLGATEVAILASYVSVVDFTIGDLIVSSSELPTWIGILLKGKMSTMQDGKEIHEHEVGSVIGVETLFGNEPRGHDIVGQTKGYIAVITMGTLLSLCEQAPHLAIFLIRFFGSKHLESIANNPREHSQLKWNTVTADVLDMVNEWIGSTFRPTEMGADVADDLIERMQFHTFDPDEPLLDRLSTDDYVCFVVSGTVQLCTNGVRVQRVSTGEVIWSARFFDRSLCIHDVVGESAGILAGIHFKAIEELATSNVHLALALLRMLGIDAAKNAAGLFGIPPVEPIALKEASGSHHRASAVEVFYAQKLKQLESEDDAAPQLLRRSPELSMDGEAVDGESATPPGMLRKGLSSSQLAAASERLEAYRDHSRLLESKAHIRQLEDEVWRLKKANAELLVQLEQAKSRHGGWFAQAADHPDAPRTPRVDTQEVVRLRGANSQLRKEVEAARGGDHLQLLEELQKKNNEYAKRVLDLESQVLKNEASMQELAEARLVVIRKEDEKRAEIERILEVKEETIRKLEHKFLSERNKWTQEAGALNKALSGLRRQYNDAKAGASKLDRQLGRSVQALGEELFVVENENRDLRRDLQHMRVATKCMGIAFLMRKCLKQRSLDHLSELRELEAQAHAEKLSKEKRQHEAQLRSLQSELAQLKHERKEHKDVVSAITSELNVLRVQETDLRAMLHEQTLQINMLEADLAKQRVAGRAQLAHAERQAAMEAQRVQNLRKKLAATASMANEMQSKVVRTAEVEAAFGCLLRTDPVSCAFQPMASRQNTPARSSQSRGGTPSQSRGGTPSRGTPSQSFRISQSASMLPTVRTL